MRRSLSLALCATVALSGCAYIPYFKKFAKKKYFPYLGNPMFSFEHPRKWKGPYEIPGGVEFREPKGRAAVSAAFHPIGDKQYKTPVEYRKHMSAWGAVEDSHVVFAVEVASRPAHRVEFTTYDYDPAYLLGEEYRVWTTEVIMVPDPRGIFVLKYHAPRTQFHRRKFRKHYDYLLKNIVLNAPPVEDDF